MTEQPLERPFSFKESIRSGALTLGRGTLVLATIAGTWYATEALGNNLFNEHATQHSHPLSYHLNASNISLVTGTLFNTGSRFIDIAREKCVEGWQNITRYPYTTAIIATALIEGAYDICSALVN